jgi:hypothetical protein
MDEEIKNTEEQEDNLKFDEVKAKAEEKFSKFQSDMMILGVRIGSRTINNMIAEFKQTPGKKSTNDYKRLIKKIEDFCNRSLAKDEFDEKSSTEETTQN